MNVRPTDELYLRRAYAFSEEEFSSFGIFYTALLSDGAQKLFWHMYGYSELSVYPSDKATIIGQLNFTDEDFSRYTDELIKYGLIKTYVKEDETSRTFIFEVRAPKTARNFLEHPVLSRYFLAKSGIALYTKIRNEIPRETVKLDGFTEWKEDTGPIIDDVWNEQDEKNYRDAAKPFELRNYEPSNTFDYTKFFENCTERVFPVKFRTKDNLDYIGETAVLFGIDPKRMVAHVGQSMVRGSNRTLTAFDRSKLYLRCKDDMRNTEKKETGNPYDIAPAEFLRMRQNGVRKLSDADARLLDDLIHVWKLTAPAANVLIEHVLNTSGGELKRTYTEKIAASFVRADVKTAEEALRQIADTGMKKVPAPAVKKARPEKKTPAPVTEENDSDAEREELLKLLKG